MLQSKVTVTTAADEAARRLVLLADIRAEIGYAAGDTADDAKITTLITQASAAIQAYLGRTIAREVISETFRPDRPWTQLPLSRWPVTAIASITENGTALTAADYEFGQENGLLSRLDASDRLTCWPDGKITVAYTAGWVCPGAGGTTTLPADITRAATELVKIQLFGATRDPLVQREVVPGVGETFLQQSLAGADADLPPYVRALLAPYRGIRI